MPPSPPPYTLDLHHHSNGGQDFNPAFPPTPAAEFNDPIPSSTNPNPSLSPSLSLPSSPTTTELDDPITPSTNPNPSCGIDDSGWIHCTEQQLMTLLRNSLKIAYEIALADLVKLGIDEEVARRTFLQIGNIDGPKDVVSNIIDHTLQYLNDHPPAPPPLPDDDTAGICYLGLLHSRILATTIFNMNVLRPNLTMLECMWCLYMSDLHLHLANTMEIPSYAISTVAVPATGGDGSSISEQQLTEEGPVMEDLPDLDGMASLTRSVESVSISEEKVAPDAGAAEGHNEIETDEAYKLSASELEKHGKREKMQEAIDELWRQHNTTQRQLMKFLQIMNGIEMKSSQEVEAEVQAIFHEEHRAKEAVTACIKIRDEALQLELYRDSQRLKDNIQRLEELSGSTSQTSSSGEETSCDEEHDN